MSVLNASELYNLKRQNGKFCNVLQYNILKKNHKSSQIYRAVNNF